MGYLDKVRLFGGEVLRDTCWCMITKPILPDRVGQCGSGFESHDEGDELNVEDEGSRLGSMSVGRDGEVSGEIPVHTESESTSETTSSGGKSEVASTKTDAVVGEESEEKGTETSIMTNSAKYAHYGPGLSGLGVHFGGMEECVEVACRGYRIQEVPG